MKRTIALAIFALAISGQFSAQQTLPNSVKKAEEQKKEDAKKPDEGNRNMMLNASVNEGPRQINIGLPPVNAADMVILENDLPVVYQYWPHYPTAEWRADGSYSKIGLAKLGELVLTTGKVAYGTTSFTRLGTEQQEYRVNYKTNNYGLQQFDITLNGPLSKDKKWLYSASSFQNFDPGAFDYKFGLADRTSFFKAAVTRKLQKGELSILYKHSNSTNLTNLNSNGPFVYDGKGGISPYNGFELGQMNYAPIDGMLTYMDTRDGSMHDISAKDASKNVGDAVAAIFKYDLGNGWKLNANAKYSYTDAGLLVYIPTSTAVVDNSAGYTVARTGQSYAGGVQNSLYLYYRGKVTDFMTMGEVAKKFKAHQIKIGVNSWYNYEDYFGSRGNFAYQAQENPEILEKNGVRFSGFNNGGEYVKGKEFRNAVYISDEWKPTENLNLFFGGRLESLTISGENLATPHNYNNFYVGSTHPTTGVVAQLTPFSKSWILPSVTFNATYNFTPKMGLLLEALYAKNANRLPDWAGTGPVTTDPTTIPYGRLGVFYNHPKLSLVSALTYIGKTNIQSYSNLVDPISGTRGAQLLKFDVETMGWITDVVYKPFKGFQLHYMLQLQQPKYKNYAFNIFNTDYDFSGNIVQKVSQTLMEIDPSYSFSKFRVWASLRYFGKQYANYGNILYFNPHWETFGGLDYNVNKNLTCSLSVINFLNQNGALGTIGGSDLWNNDSYLSKIPAFVAGGYIKPFTLEFKVGLKF